MCEQPEERASRFRFNGPTAIGLLYLATYFTVLSPLIGVILAYGWQGQAVPDWQRSQFAYLIRTFWLGLGGYAAMAAMGLVAIALDEKHLAEDGTVGALAVLCGGGLLLITALLLARCALVIVKAQQGVPIARPRTWLV